MHDIESVWTVLAVESISSNPQLVVAPVGASVAAGDLLAAVDAVGNKHLLIPLQAGEAFAPDQEGTSLHLMRVVHGGVSYVSAVCLRRSLDSVFAQFARELVVTLAGQVNAGITARNAFKNWKLLFSDGANADRLSTDAQVGLFGELTYLAQVLEAGTASTTDCWTGPDRSQHDFKVAGTAVEVKTSRAREGRRVTISSVDQLDAALDYTLYLAYFRIEIDPMGLTLPGLADHILESVVDQELFRSQLSNAGYWKEHADSYTTRYRVTERRMYDVLAGGFPRITRRSFIEDKLPAGIVGLSYTIDLTNEPPTPILPDDEAQVLLAIGSAG